MGHREGDSTVNNWIAFGGSTGNWCEGFTIFVIFGVLEKFLSWGEWFGLVSWSEVFSRRDVSLRTTESRSNCRRLL